MTVEKQQKLFYNQDIGYIQNYAREVQMFEEGIEMKRKIFMRAAAMALAADMMFSQFTNYKQKTNEKREKC
ncbi:MAG: hypothetical protein IKS17_05310 [Firmicutes bacterium]|nr:hypothetical protein [Bacillota bacterium]